MTQIQRPNTRFFAAIFAVAFIFGSAGIAFQQMSKPATAKAAAVYPYASEPQWYNGPVAKPVLSRDYMAFITLWEGNGLNLYLTDLNKKKDYKISLQGPVSSITDLSISSNMVAWQDTYKNKWQVRAFDLNSYTTQNIIDSMNEIGRPSVDNNRVVWREANNDSFGSMIRLFDNSTKEIRTLTAGKWYTDPVISGNKIAWLESANSCGAAPAYRLCTPTDGTWEVVVYNLTSNTMQTVAQNVYAPKVYSPALNGNSVIWLQKKETYDLFRFNLTTNTLMRLTNNELIESEPVAQGGRVAYIGIPNSGAPKFAHVFDLDEMTDTVMPHQSAEQAHVTVWGNRVAWAEKRDDSRIYIYDYKMPAQAVDVDHDGLTAAEETKSGSNDSAKDTDGDGIPDADEVVLFGTNPSAMDSDGDGLTDYQEAYVYHSNPMKFDTDGDGYNDGREVANNYSPTNPKPTKVAKGYWEATAPIKVKAAAIK